MRPSPLASRYARRRRAPAPLHAVPLGRPRGPRAIREARTLAHHSRAPSLRAKPQRAPRPRARAHRRASPIPPASPAPVRRTLFPRMVACRARAGGRTASGPPPRRRPRPRLRARLRAARRRPHRLQPHRSCHRRRSPCAALPPRCAAARAARPERSGSPPSCRGRPRPCRPRATRQGQRRRCRPRVRRQRRRTHARTLSPARQRTPCPRRRPQACNACR
mmetsp:Transcript_10181/g.42232  ORF Transcript_10181/g.42232 Transcript_10181/m.42232 type:complete len:220 (-) Transcript_10181:433-1092(-)